jgi:folate-binding protein YgfZ
MSEARALILRHRGVLRLAGPDVRDFLQGIVSNDVARVSTEQAVWTAFLTAQGKFLHEFFLVEAPEAAGPEDAPVFLLDAEAERRADLLRRLTIYKLRAKVTLADVGEDFCVAALFGDGAAERLGLAAGEPGQAVDFAGGRAYVDPRLPALGTRAILPRDGAEEALTAAGFAAATLDDYDRLRLPLGVPDGSRDLEVEKSLLLESGFEELNGLDWDKGCYMGQEVTARTKYRGLVKKRLLPVAIDGPSPGPGTPVLSHGRDVGTLRSSMNGLGLALLRLETLDGAPLTAGEARLTPSKPDWARF